MSRDTNDVGGGGDGGDEAGRKNDTSALARRSFQITGSARIRPLLSSIRRGSRRSAADTSRRGGDDSNGDREPHAALVREICSQLHHRLTVIAHTQTAEEVKEVSVQLLVALEKFRAEGIARNASAKSARVSVSGPDVPEEVAAVPGEGVSPRPKSTFDKAMNGRMAVLVERNDQESVAQVTVTTATRRRPFLLSFVTLHLVFCTSARGRWLASTRCGTTCCLGPPTTTVRAQQRTLTHTHAHTHTNTPWTNIPL